MGFTHGWQRYSSTNTLALLQSVGRLDFGYWFFFFFFFFFALSNTCTSGWNYTHYARVSGPQKALSARYARVSGQCSTDDLAVRRNHWIDGRVSGPHLKIVPTLAGHIEHRVPALVGSVLMISPSGEIAGFDYPLFIHITLYFVQITLCRCPKAVTRHPDAV